MFFVMSRAWDKCHERRTEKRFWVPIRNRASDFRIPRSDALPLSYRDSTASEIYMNFVIYELRKIDLDLRRVSVGQRLYLA